MSSDIHICIYIYMYIDIFLKEIVQNVAKPPTGDPNLNANEALIPKP